jgi:hypothetical protein
MRGRGATLVTFTKVWEAGGTGLVLVSLFGCLTLPGESVSGMEPTASQGCQGYQDYRDYRDYRSYRRPGYEPPDRFTIHKGKKCEIRCERIWGTRDYRCRDYRC